MRGTGTVQGERAGRSPQPTDVCFLHEAYLHLVTPLQAQRTDGWPLSSCSDAMQDLYQTSVWTHGFAQLMADFCQAAVMPCKIFVLFSHALQHKPRDRFLEPASFVRRPGKSWACRCLHRWSPICQSVVNHARSLWFHDLWWPFNPFDPYIQTCLTVGCGDTRTSLICVTTL